MQELYPDMNCFGNDNRNDPELEKPGIFKDYQELIKKGWNL
jgi:hypothetical protein